MLIEETCERIISDQPLKALVEIERSIDKTYRKELLKPFIKAIIEFELLAPGDKVGIAISGGKDSLLLAKLFQALKKHNKYEFELVFLNMDPGFHEINRKSLIENCKHLGIPIEVRNSSIFEVVGKIAHEHPCYLCARMRRGFLYKMSKDAGCNKLALGHHFDDVIETTLLNMFYGGTFKTMVPKIKAENFEEIELIRPLVYVKEHDIKRWINSTGLNAMNCGCTVAALKTSSKRREIKLLIENLRKTNPQVDLSIFNSAMNINLDAVLGYEKQGVKHSFVDIYNERNGDKGE